MKIAIIGTTAYQNRMTEHAQNLLKEGHEVKMPAFDSIEGDEYAICKYNRSAIEWSDRVHVLWDARSVGTIFDLGMCFAMRKPIDVIFMQPKRFPNFVEQYEERGSDG